MAVIKLGSSGSSSRLINYAEKRAEVSEGIDCSPDYAKQQFATTRELYGKSDGIQAHHVIQSFAPNEITPELANKIGLELAKQLAPEHEVVVFTHADKEHIHNHIIINSVNYETGKKLHLHGVEAIEKTREISDKLCEENDLSVIKEPTSKIRYTLAEQGILQRSETSWKDDIREVIDFEKQNSNTYAEFKTNLTEKYGIEVNDQRKHITYKHPEMNKVVRGNKLGLDYERSSIENGFNRQNEQQRGNSNRDSSTSQQQSESVGRTSEFIGGNQRTQSANEELHNGSDGQGHDKPTDSNQRNNSNRGNEQDSPKSDGFDFEKARKHVQRATRKNAENVSSVSKPDARTREQQQSKAREIEQRNREQHEQRNNKAKSRGWEHER